jgi:hypothetical protein
MFAAPRRITRLIGVECILSGAHLGRRERARPSLVFEDATGKQVEFDLRGTLEQVLARARPEGPERAGPGRPKLGVVSREVSLLPRHGEWLERHPQGISAALRRLVDDARKRALWSVSAVRAKPKLVGADACTLVTR